MEYVNHEMDMSSALNKPGLSSDQRPMLNPDIEDATLEMLYGQVAKILLQLAKLEFPLIGALEETQEWSWEVTRRPLSMPINELARIGTVPQKQLPTTTFNSTSEYITYKLWPTFMSSICLTSVMTELPLKATVRIDMLLGIYFSGLLPNGSFCLARKARAHSSSGAMTCGHPIFYLTQIYKLWV